VPVADFRHQRTWQLFRMFGLALALLQISAV